ncbi:MAG: serine/threonine protein kinase [Pirellulaceae bacterium]
MALQKLGPFELLKVLGRGGMGTVYEAREDGTTSTVAVKALSPAYSFDTHFRNRFEGEIDALMKLDHENIVRLLSYGQDEGVLFFAMELVNGNSLFEEQKQGQVFHWREIIDIGIQVCAGLRHAHDRGIIHRDLKPGNLMVDQDRHVKITDFGIAKTYGSSSLTSEGNVLGTMDYMAPEQARGQVATVRSDLFALGAVMYSLLAGRPPFLQNTVEKTFESLLSTEPPDRLDKVALDIPGPLAKLIHRLLEKDPERRIATALATGRQLEHVLEAVKNTPKMETQVVPAEEEVKEDGSTFVVTNSTTGHRGQGDTSARQGSRFHATAVSRESDPESQTDTGTHAKGEEVPARRPDYFNEVTPQQRYRKRDEAEKDDSSNPWPLLVALLAVIGVSAAGVWYTVIRAPAADELLAEIRVREHNPVRVQDQINRFLELYPEHEEASYVREARDFVEVLQYRNTLRLRQNSTRNPLSFIEREFLKIAEMKPDDAPLARFKMEAFLSMCDAQDTLSDDETRAWEMGQLLDIRIQREAKSQMEQGHRLIEGQLREARNSSPGYAIGVYQSIIEVWGEYPWAAEWVEIAREEEQKCRAELESSTPGTKE